MAMLSDKITDRIFENNSLRTFTLKDILTVDDIIFHTEEEMGIVLDAENDGYGTVTVTRVDGQKLVLTIFYDMEEHQFLRAASYTADFYTGGGTVIVNDDEREILSERDILALIMTITGWLQDGH